MRSLEFITRAALAVASVGLLTGTTTGCDVLAAAGNAALAAAAETDNSGDASLTGGGTAGGAAGCVPECVAKQCGPDGCGGSCGSCGAGKTCTAAKCTVIDANTCLGRCGEYQAAATCQCDEYCVESGDCCEDREALCSGAAAEAGCGSVPEAGVCDGVAAVRYCLQASGTEPPSVLAVPCEGFETCGIDSDGWASCQLKAGSCEPGTAACVDGATQKTCTKAGTWKNQPCANCQAGALTVTCGGKAARKVGEITVKYEFRSANNELTGWGPLALAPLTEALIWTGVPDDDGVLQIVSSAQTDGQGRANIEIPPGKEAVATLILVAAKSAASGALTDFDVVMLRPDVADGEQPIDKVLKGNAKVWNWQVPAKSVMGGTWTVHEAQLSGVLRVFDYARYVYSSAAGQFGKKGPSVGIWMRPNTEWSCGACFTAFPHSVGAVKLKSHIWIPMTAKDTSYWSDAVSAHELGHWVMEAFGESPSEGGTHFLQCATFPGQAWSEGWATWVSSATRGNPLYFDSQEGSFFWFDIAQQKTNKGKEFPTPQADKGWLQYQSENWVAGTLWAMTSPGAVGESAFSASDNQFLLKALSSARMTKAPFGRGYTRHTWDLKSGTCGFINVKNTGATSPMIADYLDAVVCADKSMADLVEAAVGSYPYPVAKPICK